MTSLRLFSISGDLAPSVTFCILHIFTFLFLGGNSNLLLAFLHLTQKQNPFPSLLKMSGCLPIEFFPKTEFC